MAPQKCFEAYFECYALNSNMQYWIFLSTAVQLVWRFTHFLSKNEFSFLFPGLAAGLVCEPALSCALREASAKFCKWSNIPKAPGAPAPGLFHESIWALRIINFFILFFFMSGSWCWPELFHSMSHFPRAHQVLSYPSTFWQGGKR